MTHPVRNILNHCAAIADQRGVPYGSVEDNFGRAATLAGVLTGKDLAPADVALVLHAVKLARIAGDPGHADSYDDGINYLAFARHLRGIPDPAPKIHDPFRSSIPI